MKIKAVRAYQSAPFEGKEIRHFHTGMSGGKRGVGLKIEEVKGVGVKISSSKDAIIIPFANCACIVLESSKMDASFKSSSDLKI